MFATLSERLSSTIKKLRGQGRLTEENIKDTLREIRVSLLEADVALSVVKEFIENIREKSIGQEVLTSVNPGQVLVKIVNEELVEILGKEHVPLDLKATPPVVILMVGLQGCGKTTTSAKLARMLKEQEDKKVLLVSADIYRPAAIEQLKKLAQEIEVTNYPSKATDNPVAIVKNALAQAKKQHMDVVIIDSAGRLHIDTKMMTEIKAIHQSVEPLETLLVVDSMTGQDAAMTAKAFNEALPLTGVILTKVDGDARGGAALSMRQITQQPIKFIGVGEKTEALEAFYPERIASRILGMGDIVSLVEEAERKADKKKSDKLAKKLRKGKNFDLEDYRDQMVQMNKMGGMMNLMQKIPLGGAGGGMNAMQQAQSKSMEKAIPIINSMTPQERHFPKIINGSRKRRIAKGSGNDIQEVNRLLKQFTQMQKMMKKMSKPGAMKKLMRGMQG
ncbi:MAG: signal recognition particle protein [Gammaproteobacteria bacterium]